MFIPDCVIFTGWTRFVPRPRAGDGMEQLHTAETVEARLLDAGRTLMALWVGGTRPAGYRSAMPEFVRVFEEDVRYQRTAMPVLPPAPRAISAMDQTLSWIGLLPRDRVVMRRVVGLRMLCRPHDTRPLFSWRRIGADLHASHEAVRQWHEQAVEVIVVALNLPGLCRLSGGKVGPGSGEVDLQIDEAMRRAVAKVRLKPKAPPRPVHVFEPA